MACLDELTAAITNEDVPEFIRCANSGLDINGIDSNGWTPLMAAIEAGNFFFCEMLVNGYGADIDREGADRGWTPVLGAIHYRQKRIFEFLMENEAVIEGYCNSVLSYSDKVLAKRWVKEYEKLDLAVALWA